MVKIRGTMIDEYDNGTMFVNFESIPAVFRAIDKQGWTPQRAKASDIPGDGKFLVFDNLAHAHHVFQNEPWRIRQFSQKDDKLRNEDNPGNDVFFDVTGDYLDIGRHMEGEPEDFGNSIMGNPSRIFADILVNISAAKWTTAEYIIHKQKRIMRLVDWLETYGIRTRVRATLSTDVAFIGVTVKEHHDPFDLNHLAIAMHPDFMRRTCLLIMEQSRAWEFGYGDAVKFDDLALASTYADPDDGISIYVGGYMPYAPKDTERGYTYDNDTSKLDKDFDEIEKHIASMLQNDVRFTESKLKVGRPFMRIARTKSVAVRRSRW
jgi:hypothetical protein